MSPLSSTRALPLLALLTACATQAGTFRGEAPPLIADPQPKLFLPDFKSTQLDNGVRIFANEDRMQPAVTLALAFKGGWREEPLAEAGKTLLLMHALLERSARLDRMALAAALDDTAQPRVEVHPDGAIVYATVLLDRLEPFIAVLGEVLAHPAFAVEDLERLKWRQLAELHAQEDDPEAIADQVLAKVLLGDAHRASLPVEGTATSIANITPQTLEQWSRHLLRPEKLTVVAAGRVPPPRIMALLTKALRNFNPPPDSLATYSSGAAVAIDPAAAPKRKMVYGVSRPHLSQTVIRVGRLAVPFEHPDRSVLSYLAANWAGASSSYLRTLDGVTYGVGSTYRHTETLGMMAVGAAVEARATTKALDSILDNCEAVGSSGFGSESWAYGSTAMLFHENRLDYEIEPRSLALATRILQGSSTDHIKRLHDRLANFRADDFTALARRYFDPGRMQVVMVGDPEAISAATATMSFTSLMWVR